MDDAEVEWRAHMTQICHIEADAEKHQQEVLTTTNVIQDAIEKNNVIFGEKWEMAHDCINRRSEEVCLLKNRVVDLEALSGLQQNTLQSCQNTLGTRTHIPSEHMVNTLWGQTTLDHNVPSD